MFNRLNHFLDVLSNYLAHRKGLLPMISIVLILINLVFQFLPSLGWLGESDLLLHIGIIIAIIGMMVAWAL